jgi:hypothetical protein
LFELCSQLNLKHEKPIFSSWRSQKNTGIFRCFFQDFRYKYRFLPESKSSRGLKKFRIFDKLFFSLGGAEYSVFFFFFSQAEFSLRMLAGSNICFFGGAKKSSRGQPAKKSLEFRALALGSAKKELTK